MSAVRCKACLGRGKILTYTDVRWGSLYSHPQIRGAEVTCRDCGGAGVWQDGNFISLEYLPRDLLLQMAELKNDLLLEVRDRIGFVRFVVPSEMRFEPEQLVALVERAGQIGKRLELRGWVVKY